MRKSPLFPAGKIALQIILISVSAVCSNAYPDYEMEKLAEFTPADSLSITRLGIGYPNPFGSKPDNLVEPHHSPFFKVDNNGRIYYCSYTKKLIIIYDFLSGDIDSLIPSLSENESLNYILLGPNNEIYTKISTCLAPYGKLYRYFNFDGDYIPDNNFISPAMLNSHKLINISPSGKIYIGEQSPSNYDKSVFDVYSPNGNFLKSSSSPCETSDGSDFYLKKSDLLAQDDRTSIKINNGKELILGTYYHLSLKCTLNNLIIIIVKDYKRISLDDDKELVVDKPCAHIVDLNKGHITIHPYYQCVNPDFLYHTVSNLESNFKGEIYATVIYFNAPGKVVGDEKIVLYRWISAGE